MFLQIYTCKLDQDLESIKQYSLMNSSNGIQIWLTKSQGFWKKTVSTLLLVEVSDLVLKHSLVIKWVGVLPSQN